MHLVQKHKTDEDTRQLPDKAHIKPFCEEFVDILL